MNRDFRLLFTAAAVSRLGTSITYVAMPLIAVTALRASPGEVGLLATLSTVAFLVIGLPAGAWTDRLRRRGVLITADLARAAVLLSVPVAGWLGALTMGQLYVVVLLTGIGTVFFDVANQSYLPQVVGRTALLAANTRLVSMDAVNNIAGRGVAGFVVALVTAPAALLLDAASYVVSAWCVWRIHHREPRPSRPEGRGLVREGVVFVATHPVLRALAVAGAVSNLGIVLVLTMLPVVLVDELGLGAGVLGLFLASGGVGMLVGSLLARGLAARFGAGRVVLLANVVVAPFGFGMSFVGHGPALWLAGVTWLAVTTKVGVDNVLSVSFRQQVTPDALLGRVMATFRFLLTGALAVAAGLAGVLGEWWGPRSALVAGGCALACVWLPALLSPLRHMRELAPVPQKATS
ncbi:MFS transporter [Actinophytocola sp. NPDC049390]|uniref:MFS transporter n=1 Tax=Actinophytocola sp. NPDC049390 TaxID=3363894 RepID=UPI00378BD65E